MTNLIHQMVARYHTEKARWETMQEDERGEISLGMALAMVAVGLAMVALVAILIAKVTGAADSVPDSL